MNGLIRKATLFSLGCGLIASSAMAGVPGWAGSTQPVYLKIGGTLASVPLCAPGPSPCTDPKTSNPAGNYTIVDANLVPVPNTRVRIDLSACTDIRLCSSQDNPDGIANNGDVGEVRLIACTAISRIVEGTTDGSGNVKFRIRGGGAGGLGTPSNVACATVSLPDNPAAGAGNPLFVAAFDLTGGAGVEPLDLSVWAGDFTKCFLAPNTYRQRSDYDGSGPPCTATTGITPTDLSQWGGDFAQMFLNGGASCGAYCNP